MRRVKQKDSNGCGLACIAMLANKTYKEVRKIAVTKVGLGDGGFYTGTKELRALSDHYGIVLGKRRRPFKSFAALPETAILAINYKKAEDRWHWVVYRRSPKDEFIYDPKKTIKSNKRRDFGRIKEKAKWFLPVIKM